jgi:hypothetical protein
LIRTALDDKRLVALLFYNPAASDDLAVKRELAQIPTAPGRVLKVALPITQLGTYASLTSQVPVNQSPTLLLIDPAHQATTIVGFADSFEIAQRIRDALAAG